MTTSLHECTGNELTTSLGYTVNDHDVEINIGIGFVHHNIGDRGELIFEGGADSAVHGAVTVIDRQNIDVLVFAVNIIAMNETGDMNDGTIGDILHKDVGTAGHAVQELFVVLFGFGFKGKDIHNWPPK